MKNYIKPTFTLAGLFPVALAGLSCDIKLKGENLYSLYEQFGYSEDMYNITFAASEVECADAPIPDDLVSYCKFTSNAETTNGVALTS